MAAMADWAERADSRPPRPIAKGRARRPKSGTEQLRCNVDAATASKSGEVNDEDSDEAMEDEVDLQERARGQQDEKPQSNMSLSSADDKGASGGREK